MSETGGFEHVVAMADGVQGVPFVSLIGHAQADLSHGFFTGIGIGGETHFMRVSGLAGQGSDLQVGFAARGSLGAGKRF